MTENNRTEKPWLFQPGQSGNPGGRPRELKEVIALARQHTAAAVEALFAIAAGGQNEAARVSAASALLDRGWGKPVQPHDGDGDGGPIVITYRWAKGDDAA